MEEKRALDKEEPAELDEIVFQAPLQKNIKSYHEERKQSDYEGTTDSAAGDSSSSTSELEEDSNLSEDEAKNRALHRRRSKFAK